MPVDKEKEKARKQKWYADNKELLKERRKSKDDGTAKQRKSKDDETAPSSKAIPTNRTTFRTKVKEPTEKKSNLKTVKILFFAAVILAASSLLVVFSVDVLGNTITGWVTSILLEVGIISLAVGKPKQKAEYWFVKGCFVSFVVLSFFILHNGNQEKKSEYQSKDEVLTEKLDAVRRLKKNLDQLPDNRITDRQKGLDQVTQLTLNLDPTVTGGLDLGTFTSLASRVMLLILNFVFSHALLRCLLEPG